MHKRRILMIIPNLDFGGAQNSFSRLSQLLKPYCQLQLVVFNMENIAPLPMGGPLLELGVPGSHTTISKLVNFFKRVKRLRKIKQQFRPDVSISFLEGADYVNMLSSIKEKIYFYVHGSKLHDRNISGGLGLVRKKILIPFFYSKADCILVVNDQLSKELAQHFKLAKAHFHCLPNFFDFDELESLAEVPIPEVLLTLFESYITITISGRVAPEKGIDRFIKLLPELVEKVHNLKILILGDGPQMQFVKQVCNDVGIRFQDVDSMKSQTLNLDSTIFFLGYQENPFRYIRKSTLLVLPSLNEGMPNTIIEAMGLGVPVVAADCPYGPRELLTNHSNARQQWPEIAEYGILVPILNNDMESKQAWLDAIIMLIQSEELRKDYSAKGKAKSREFSKDDNLQKWKKLLRL